MPKGVYEKSRLYHKTSKLTGALNALKSQDPYFQVDELMTNEDIFIKLKEFGFIYRQGVWSLPPGKSSSNGSNGHKPRLSVPSEATVVTIKPIATDRLEMCMGEGQLDTLQNVIEAMHTLGFKVEVKIVGTR